jgi:hypothetical protein
MRLLSARYQKKENLRKNAPSIRGQTVVEFVLVMSIFAVAMLAITAGLSRGFGIATKRYIYMYDFNPTQREDFKRFSY